MENRDDYIELVRKAQSGDDGSLERLAEVARGRLVGYVRRVTLDDDLAQDIVQESILEMLRIFDKLKRADRFWGWLYGIANNKTRSHYGKSWRRREVSLAEVEGDVAGKGSANGLEDMVTAELKGVVVASMKSLEPRHRAILSMRCYESMPYSKIAEAVGCSEIGARAMFYRAKRSLAKQLSSRGFGRGSMVMALVVFGKLTATSEAAAANVTLTAATLKVGLGGAVVGAVLSGKGLVTLGTAAVLAVGTALVVDKAEGPAIPVKAGAETVVSAAVEERKDASMREVWQYYPAGGSDVVMTRVLECDSRGEVLYCSWISNESFNYRYDGGVVRMVNSRWWSDGFSAGQFSGDTAGLLTITSVDGGEVELKEVAHHYNLLDETYFKFGWTQSAKVVDERDAMHKRGWTYFTVTGHLDGEAVEGSGRLPFVYVASHEHWQWMRLNVGGEIYVDEGFAGLGRPWAGLHTIDTVRRDAAEVGVWFESKVLQGGKAEVLLRHGESKLVYTIDMGADVIDKMTFLSEGDEVIGELEFSYMQDITTAGEEFSEPRRSYRQSRGNRGGILWLFELIGTY